MFKSSCFHNQLNLNGISNNEIQKLTNNDDENTIISLRLLAFLFTLRNEFCTSI